MTTVQPQVVGSALVPLLQTVPSSANHSDVTTITFQTPFYLQLSRNFFDTASVLLCNELGEQLHIGKGMATFSLHLRKNSTSITYEEAPSLLKHPFSCMLCGPSELGKTSLQQI